jgi:hypothetical protein
MQPLAFDDLNAIVAEVPPAKAPNDPRRIDHELELIERVQQLHGWLLHSQSNVALERARADQAEALAESTRATLDEVLGSKSWRITAPLRAALERRRAR